MDNTISYLIYLLLESLLLVPGRYDSYNAGATREEASNYVQWGIGLPGIFCNF